MATHPYSSGEVERDRVINNGVLLDNIGARHVLDVMPVNRVSELLPWRITLPTE